MKLNKILDGIVALACVAGVAVDSEACTNLIAGKKATTDGSVMMTYSADSHNLYGMLRHSPAGKHPKGTMRKITDWDSGKPLGEIPEASVTYNVVGNMNEHQRRIHMGGPRGAGRHHGSGRDGLRLADLCSA